MINAEFYKEELRKIINEDGEIAVDKKTRKPIRCFGTECKDCYLYTIEGKNDCGIKGYKWLLTEHKEYPVLTKFQYELLNKAYEKGMQWLSRDSDCDLLMWVSKPEKTKHQWDSTDNCALIAKIFDDFNFIKWEDEEPWSIQELLENCEVEK